MKAILVATAVVGALLVPALSASPAAAQPFTVATPSESALSQAITSANTTPGPDEVQITATGPIDLSGPLPSISTDMTITGPGVSQLAVRRGSGAGSFSVFRVTTDISASPDVVIRGLTVSNGRALRGAGIDIAAGATLHLTDAAVVNNTATAVANNANIWGGGIYNAGALTVQRSTVSGNTAVVEGDNAGSVGGGIMNEGNLVVDRSTISGNNVLSFGLAHAIGGGIYTGFAGTLAMTLSTVTGNTANADTTLRQEEGGGISGNTPGPSITSSTLASNAAVDGANLHLTATIQNTLIATPLGGGENCGETANTSTGFNLATDASCQLTQPSDLPGTPAGLMSLANNGGPTETMALTGTSAAVDAGTSAGFVLDQRGLGRPFDFASALNADDGSDIGALELHPAPPPPDDTTSPTAGTMAPPAGALQPPLDTTAPTLQLSGAPAQRVLRQRGVLAVVSCPVEACTASAKGKVVVRGSGKVYKLTPASKQIGIGASARLKLKLRKRALTAIKRALMRGKKVSAKVTVTANDTVGNVTTKRPTVTLKR